MNEKILDKILLKIVEMDEKLNNLPNIFVTKIEFQEAIDRITTSIDGFTQRYKHLDLEILANRSRTERLEGRVEKVESRLGLET